MQGAGECPPAGTPVHGHHDHISASCNSSESDHTITPSASSRPAAHTPHNQGPAAFSYPIPCGFSVMHGDFEGADYHSHSGCRAGPDTHRHMHTHRHTRLRTQQIIGRHGHIRTEIVACFSSVLLFTASHHASPPATHQQAQRHPPGQAPRWTFARLGLGRRTHTPGHHASEMPHSRSLAGPTTRCTSARQDRAPGSHAMRSHPRLKPGRGAALQHTPRP